MAVESELSPDGKKLTIRVKGRFDFGKHQEFRKTYEDDSGRSSRQFDAVVVDLKEATYLDSSALGMLLLLRDHAGKKSQISVINTTPDVRKILAISNFEKIFEIS